MATTKNEFDAVWPGDRDAGGRPLVAAAVSAPLGCETEDLLRMVDAADLLRELTRRGGAPAALGEAGLLAFRKADDYNDGRSRDEYFPLGLASYAQMLHVKVTRLLSLSRRPREAANEPARDTALDIVNYASFLADWLGRQR